jgi:hypothetical protein
MNNNLENQIKDMLEKVIMIDDFDETRTIDTSTYEPQEWRKDNKAKTYQTGLAGNSVLYKNMQQRVYPERKIQTTFLPSNKDIFKDNIFYPGFHQKDSNIMYNGNLDVNFIECNLATQLLGLNEKSINSNLNDCIFHGIEKILSSSDKIDEKLYGYVKGHFIAIIKTQNGSRIFQKYLKNTSQTIISKIFEEILPYVRELLLDSYANYFCQKFYGVIQFNEKILWLKAVYIY